MGAIGSALGFGNVGDYYKAGSVNGPRQQQFDEAAQTGEKEMAAMRDAGMAQALQGYATGGTSLADALQQVTNHPQGYARQQEFATSPLAAGRFAQEQVGTGPLTGRLFGTGDSALSRAMSEEQQYAKPEASRLGENEYTQYGQLAGQAARLSGQQEQSLAQMLAARGLSSAPSGAAGAAFSGLAGNKFEQLAGIQQNIARQKFQDTMTRLQSARDLMTNLAGQQQNAINSQLQSQFQGRAASEAARAQRMGELQASAGGELNRLTQQQQLAMQEAASRAAATTPTLGEAFGRGLLGSAEMIGASPGTGAQSFSQEFGGGLGKISSLGIGGLAGVGGGKKDTKETSSDKDKSGSGGSTYEVQSTKSKQWTPPPTTTYYGG